MVVRLGKTAASENAGYHERRGVAEVNYRRYELTYAALHMDFTNWYSMGQLCTCAME